MNEEREASLGEEREARGEEPEASLGETLDRILNLVRRRRRWILVPACSIALGTIAIVLRLPSRYSAEATLVMQQQILQRYVLPANPTSNAEVIESITREVLSRAHLLGIIDEFNLYAKQRRKNATSEALVGLIRHDIDIQSLDPRAQSDFNAFKISFTADRPQLAQTVTSKLVQLFIDENVKLRENRATSTTVFLGDQVEATKRKLMEQEQRLRDFRGRHLGQLPEQEAATLGTLTDLRVQLQNTMNRLGRAEENRASLEASLAGSLARLQSERVTLLTRYTPRHPEVVKKDQQITKTEAVLKSLKGEGGGAETLQSLLSPDDVSLSDFARQVEVNRREIDDLSKGETRLRADIAQCQDRLNLTPIREQELTAILRDYDAVKQQYTDLQAKQVQSQLATNLEESPDSLKFRLIDPPSLPEVPTGPKRLKITLGGIGAGLFLGAALAFLAEGRDRSFHSEKALSQRVALPLVLGVPLLLTPREERACTWKGAAEWLAGSVMTLAVLAAEYYVYRHG